MLALTINNLKIRVMTDGGLFGVDVPFSDGLNIIRAENSSGKSTCINAIAYALGLESVLGPSRKKPFPRSVTRALSENKDKENGKEFLVKKSYVELVITSKLGGPAKISRDIAGLDNKVTVETEGRTEDFFLGVSGTIGAAKSSRGFHYWLERFVGWKMPELTTYDGKPTRLYLECIFPLFFIEQKRGWSEIQANTPTQYGIRNLKRSSLEFCLGLEDYDKQNKVSALKLNVKELEAEWERNQSSAASLAEFSHAKMDVLFSIPSTSKEFISPFVYYITQGEVESELSALLKGLKRHLEEIKKEDFEWPLSKDLEVKLGEHRSLSRKLLSSSQKKEAEVISLAKLQKKINQINFDLDRYRQLKRLKDVGSSQNIDISVEKCPICDSDMFESFTHVEGGIRPITVEQNIDYLKNQSDFYHSIKENLVRNLKQVDIEISALNIQIESVEEDINLLRSDEEKYHNILMKTGVIRRKIELENAIKEYGKVKSQLDVYNERARKVYNDLDVAKKALIIAEKEVGKMISAKVIAQLEKKLKDNLKLFGYDRSNIGYVKISNQTLRPELDGYDIVADSSASDYIRIIWSYTLALMELGIEFESVKHSGFVVFDEPRQHEANKESFSSLLNKAVEMSSIGGQVIVATSMKKAELAECDLGDNVKLKIFEDEEYIIQRIDDGEY